MNQLIERLEINSSDTMMRYQEVLRTIAEDDTAVRLLDQMVKDAGRYFAAVVQMEHRLRGARLRLEGQELRSLSESLDRSRTLAHDALIASLHAANRHIVREFSSEVPAGGIFPHPDSIRDRVAVADWAGELLASIYRSRKR